MSEKEKYDFSYLSKRIKFLLTHPELGKLKDEVFKPVQANRYHPVTNPQGVADLGLAENKLCTDLISKKLQEISLLPEETSTLYYGSWNGKPSFRSAMKRFLEKYFKPSFEICADDIIISNGTTVVLENVAFAICDAGDYVMTIAPYYYRYKNDFIERADVKVLDLPFSVHEDTSKILGWPELTLENLEETYKTATEEGKRIKMFLLTNPNNPTGDLYTIQQLNDIIQFCFRHKIHLISNEIYGLSTFNPDREFVSVLSLPIPDPSLVHLAWGFSKSFGLSGYRCAIFHTRNKPVRTYFIGTGIYTRCVELIQHRLEALVKDEDWIDNVFHKALIPKLRGRFDTATKDLSKLGVYVHPSSGAIFLWINLSKFMTKVCIEAEFELCQLLISKGVLLLPGTALSCPNPGWFRIIFTLDDAVHETGMSRLIDSLQELKDKHTDK